MKLGTSLHVVLRGMWGAINTLILMPSWLAKGQLSFLYSGVCDKMLKLTISTSFLFSLYLVKVINI
jgi:hypothetical protein